MMMMGEGLNPTVQVPPWTFDDQSSPYSMPVSGVSNGGELSPYALGEAALAALQRWLPSNEYVESDDGGVDSPVDAYSSDEFRMYEFKIRRCTRGRSHDWTECPFAHPGEKARRRDPRKYHYSGTACPEFRKGGCKRGDTCEFAHGVFECWLHPTRYRTQPCKDGTACRRRVCFFAHTPEQLRVLPNSAPHSPEAQPWSYDGSPLRQQTHLEVYFPKSLFSSSPTSTLISPPVTPPSDSPPLSPSGTALCGGSMPTASVNEVLQSLRQLQLRKVSPSPRSWGFHEFGSPRADFSCVRAGVGGFSSSPSSTARASALGGGWLDSDDVAVEEEHVVESGRALRAKMFERLIKEGGIECGAAPTAAASPDVGWVSELVK